MAKRIAIVGAGWAGLAAAVVLCKAGHKITLIEAAQHAGGRARLVVTHDTTCDNGQHLMMGAYKDLLGLLDIVGVPEEKALLRRPLRLEMRSPQRASPCLRFPSLPAPWHVIVGFMGAKGMSVSERYRALALCTHLFFSGFKLAVDISVLQWLRRINQPDALIANLWEPLCLAALNTPINQASAQIFIRVLYEVFAGHRSDSDMLFPRIDLGALFPDPALRYIKDHGGDIHFSERALTLNLRDGVLHGVTTQRGEITADHLILATSPEGCIKLVESHEALQGIAQQLSQLGREPICTIYLQYSDDTRLGTAMLGLLNGTGQWILDLSNSGHPGRMAVVVSGPGPHMDWDNTSMIERITHEIAQHFPQWPTPMSAWVIREKRATFSCKTNINKSRPPSRTPVQGLWLAGDYTDTELPATLEGALRSGKHCAEAIIGEIRSVPSA